MTRFNITLTESVDFVIQSLTKMIGGEIFVPKIKSYKIMDLVKAISSKPKIKVTNIVIKTYDSSILSSFHNLNINSKSKRKYTE